MTCELNDEAVATIARLAEQTGRALAEGTASKGGSLGAMREGVLTALAKGYDDKAAEIMRRDAMETLMAIDGELY